MQEKASRCKKGLDSGCSGDDAATIYRLFNHLAIQANKRKSHTTSGAEDNTNTKSGGSTLLNTCSKLYQTLIPESKEVGLANPFVKVNDKEEREY